MGFRSWLSRPSAADNSSWFIAFQDALSANRTAAGVPVTQSGSLGLSTVYRCRSLNADIVESTPLQAMRKTASGRASIAMPRYLENPNDEMDGAELRGQLQDSLESDGNAFALKAVTRGGQLAGLYPLNPEMVQVERVKGVGLAYDIKQDDGTMIRVYKNEMLHVRGFTPAGAVRGVSPIVALKQAIGLGMAAQQYGAQFFGNGATLSGVVEMPGPDPGEAKAKLVKESFTRKHGGLDKSHAIAILYGGAKFTPIGVKPEEAQFLETRRFNAVEIACAFGTPAWVVTDTEGSKGFVSGLYASMYMWLLTGINVRFVRMERALSALMPDSDYVKFNRNSFLAMDPAERKDFYETMIRIQSMVPNDVCALEDMDPKPWGDEPLYSVQYGGQPAAKPAPNQPAQAGFSLPEGGPR